MQESIERISYVTKACENDSKWSFDDNKDNKVDIGKYKRKDFEITKRSIKKRKMSP